MKYRAFASLLTVLVAASLGAQGPQPKLILAGLANGAIDSRLERFDPSTGLFQTVFRDQLGQFVDVSMDRANTGFHVAFHGPSQYRISGVHALRTAGTQATLASTAVSGGARVLCSELTTENVWVMGTEVEQGAGRLQGLTGGGAPSFLDIESFAGGAVRRVRVDHARGIPILAINDASGRLVSFDAFRQSQRTLASGLGRIVDFEQDPYGDVYVVATADPAAPIVAVDCSGATPTVTRFPLPASRFPTGLNVESIALIDRGELANCDLWIAANGRLVKFEWDGVRRRLVVPLMPVSFPLPVGGAVNAMIVEGGRNGLLMRGTHPNGWTLTMRLGPPAANLRYVLAGSFGTGPAIPVTPRRMINLRPDPLFFVTASGQFPSIFQDFQGDVGPEGDVTGKVSPPRAVRTAAAGLTVFFAGVVLDPGVPGGVRTTTNTVGLVLF